MSNAAVRYRRSIKHIGVFAARNLTTWAVVGTIVALTGFGPEHWFAAMFRYLPPVERLWPAWLDIRVVIVCIGVAIVVADVLFRRRAMRQATEIGPLAGGEGKFTLAPSVPIAGATGSNERPSSDAVAPKLDVKYCRAPDGVRLAYATTGSGTPLVKTANWMNHVEYDWESSAFRHFYLSLGRDFAFLRYDARGNGMSDWDVDDISLDAWVTDLETVADDAGLDRFPLLGLSQGCAISVAFAVRHPQRVSQLVLYGGFARGAYRRATNELELQKAKALATLIRTGWGEDTPAFRQLFSSLFMPGGTPEQLQKFAERQRKTTSAECAYRYFETTRNLDITELLPQVAVPTLVMHKRDDQVQPFEAGRELAAGIPGARFVALQGQNHIPLPQDPETERMLEEIRLFVKRT
jgi:pimeloyl-ACP methyl ester carboxylesterase